MANFNPILLGLRPLGPHDCKRCSDYDHYLNHCRHDIDVLFKRRDVTATKPCGRRDDAYPTQTTRA